MVLKNYDDAATFAGLALIFDPFNMDQSFGKRPLHQRLWLVCHMVFAIVCFGLIIFTK